MDSATTPTPADALAVARGLLSDEIEQCSDTQLADDLQALQVLRNVVDAAFLRRLGVFDARGGAAAEHFLSTQAWVRRSCNMSPTAAHGRVLLARKLRADMPVGAPSPDNAVDDSMTGDNATDVDEFAATAGDGAAAGSLARAVLNGDLSYEHAVTVTRALDKLPLAARAVAEALLVTQARSMDPGTLKQVGSAIRETLAPELLVHDAKAIHVLRFVNVSVTMDGRVALDGMLDPDGGAHLLAAVNALATPFGPDDNRTAAQRRHDALIEVIAVGLRAGELPATGGVQAHVAMTVDAAPFLPGGSGIPVGRTAAGLVLVGSTVERILCDSSIGRIVTAGPSHVLDVGREVRLATPAQRRGLAIRDGGCVGYGCDRPPAWTDVHHVNPWSLLGRTDFDVLCLLCRQHHILVHDDGWVCVRYGTGWIVLPPSLARDWDDDLDPLSTGHRDGRAPLPHQRALPLLLRTLTTPPTHWLQSTDAACP